MNPTEKDTINKFLSKTKHYDQLPALVKNSICDHNAKICQKYGYVRLVKSTKTGNTYTLTKKGIKFAEKLLSEQKPKIFNLMRI